MIATIHQPDFWPWYGLFQKIARADIWIVLDHVDNNPRDAALWCRRVKILNNGQGQWFSVTLNKPEQGKIGIPVKDMTLNLSHPKAANKAMRTVQMAYAKAPYFNDYFHLVEDYFTAETDNLCIRNMQFITSVLDLLNVDTKVVLSSKMEPAHSSNALLIDLLKKVDADTYLCGNGAQGYQDDELFKQQGIKIHYNQVEHFEYPQLRTDEFVPGLSIIDSLFHLGKERVEEFINLPKAL